MTRWLRVLDERDRDIYEAESMYDEWLAKRWPWHEPEPEGYDPDLDDQGVRADERERLIEGTK